MASQIELNNAAALNDKSVMFKRELINIESIQSIGIIALKHVLKVVGHELDRNDQVILKLKLPGFISVFDAFLHEVEEIDPTDFSEHTHVLPYDSLFREAEMAV